jgi:IS4 transposase
MALYRVRWPVELVIKRLKSILHIDQLRARKDSLLADLYLHGKWL